jgi:asparagine synthase (glutamine-hydrolysing)
MCSIDGYTGQHTFTIEQFGSLNSDRGPDGTSYYKSPELSIAHSLLAIQPNPSNLQQPVVSPTTGNVLAYNGEIFNSSGFDTQFLMDLLENDGPRALNSGINGMWAFVYYNRSKQTITMCRDHFGVKGLYYMEINNELLFASTPKPLYAALNDMKFKIHPNQHGYDIWSDNDRFQFGKRTPIQHIKRLAPGEIRVWDVKKHKWIGQGSHFADGWKCDPNYAFDPEQLIEIATESIAAVCTAPGISKTISLSGGLDSSLIAGVCSATGIEVTATSTSFRKNTNAHESVNEGMFEEAVMARKTAKELGMKFNTAYYTEAHSLREDAASALGTSMWDRNRIDPRYFNCMVAAKAGSKIYITGDCADELVTGYNGDSEIYWSQTATRAVLTEPQYLNHMQNSDKWKHLSEFMPQSLLGSDGFNNKRLARVFMHGDGFCTTADHLAGSFGMESRIPFLHQKLAKYLINIPSGFKMVGNSKYCGSNKYIIRELLGGFIPDHITSRKTKIGFASPWDARNDTNNNTIGNEDFLAMVDRARSIRFPESVD